MSLAHRVGLVVFELVAADGVTVLRRCPATSLTVAHQALAPGKGEFVQSAASRALGTPAPLADGVCRSCGQRPMVDAYGHRTGRCEPCQLVAHGEQQDRTRRAQGIPEGHPRGHAPRPRKRAEPIESGITPALLASMRAELDARIRAGVGKGGRPRGPAIALGKAAR